MSSRVLSNSSKIRGSSKRVDSNFDGTQGEAIADVFANKYTALYNSVSFDQVEMGNLRRDRDTLIQYRYSGSSNARTLISVQDVASCSSQIK